MVKDEMAVPQNVRTEYDTSAINVGMNAKEDPASVNVYDVNEKTHVPEADPRSLNVVERIGEIKKMYESGELPKFVDDDYVLKADIKDLKTEAE